jgi:hypothetical protein
MAVKFGKRDMCKCSLLEQFCERQPSSVHDWDCFSAYFIPLSFIELGEYVLQTRQKCGKAGYNCRRRPSLEVALNLR